MPLPLFTVDQVICHVLGDYFTQSSWLANNKVTKEGARFLSAFACLLHVLLYGLGFMLWFHPSLPALAVIMGTHFLIDHFRLASYVCWAKNLLDPGHASWDDAKQNFGFSKGTPQHISFWIMVLVDNTMHLIINALALALL